MIRVPKSPAYLWYPKDALASGRIDDLTATEECWYRRALDRAWDDEGIAADPARAAKRIGKKCTAKAAAKLLAEFFIPKRKDATKMVNPRQEIERKKYEISFRKKSDAGKESGRKRREKKDLDSEHRSNTVRTMNEQSNPNPISNKDIRKEEEREEAASPPTHPEVVFDPDRWHHPAVVLFEEIFGFKTGSGFATSVAEKVSDLGIWKTLLDNKRSFADKSLDERKRVCNWILDEYDKRVEEKKNGTGKRNGYGNKRTDAEVLAESADFYDNYDQHPIA